MTSQSHVHLIGTCGSQTYFQVRTGLFDDGSAKSIIGGDILLTTRVSERITEARHVAISGGCALIYLQADTIEADAALYWITALQRSTKYNKKYARKLMIRGYNS